MEHAMRCLVRLIRLLLGPTAVDQKFACGTSLCVLGVDHTISAESLQCRPSAAKVQRWLRRIERALDEDILRAGDAGKLAGKLSWGSSKLFGRFGRALLRPIFDQASKRNGRIAVDLRRALCWWQQILATGVSEKRPWKLPKQHPVHVFCDARGNPPHLAAVLISTTDCKYTHMPAPPELVAWFTRRSDNQILGLELLGIALAFSTFKAELTNARVIVHCDNTGAEVRQSLKLTWLNVCSCAGSLP